VGGVVVPTNSLALIEDTAFAELDLLIDVARPVITTSSKAAAASTKLTLIGEF
tara:strand:- start:160888 stop:161046 length:159 start_codon:yes stop_codon:yes gene_type:complete